MWSEIPDPVAWADVVWRTREEGGRLTGPPTGPVYATTCRLHRDGATSEALSILLQAVAGSQSVAVDFLARHIAAPFLAIGTTITILEGPKTVGTATVRRVAPVLT